MTEEVEQQAHASGQALKLTIEVAVQVALKLIETSPRSFVLDKNNCDKILDVAFHYGGGFGGRLYDIIMPEEAAPKKEEG
jgi:hypothetical protein